MSDTYIRYECAHCGWYSDILATDLPEYPHHFIECEECGKLTMPFEIISIGGADD